MKYFLLLITFLSVSGSAYSEADASWILKMKSEKKIINNCNIKLVKDSKGKKILKMTNARYLKEKNVYDCLIKKKTEVNYEIVYLIKKLNVKQSKVLLKGSLGDFSVEVKDGKIVQRLFYQ